MIEEYKNEIMSVYTGLCLMGLAIYAFHYFVADACSFLYTDANLFRLKLICDGKLEFDEQLNQP